MIALVSESMLQLLFRQRLKVIAQTERFDAISRRYHDICADLHRNSPAALPSTSSTYDWGRWAKDISAAFQQGVPIGFLSHPLIASTMVFGRRRGGRAARLRADYVEGVFGPEIARLLLREDYVGLPNVTDTKWLTSANRAHHAYHLAKYASASGKRIWDAARIVEWGGGYGDMARLIRRMREQVTYCIVDLPEMLALQYIYLFSVEGEHSVHIVRTGEGLAPGRVNLVPSAVALCGCIDLSCDAFISTWALTESPLLSQESVTQQSFWGADHVLLAYVRDENNRIACSLPSHQLQELPIELLPSGHAYAFR